MAGGLRAFAAILPETLNPAIPEFLFCFFFLCFFRHQEPDRPSPTSRAVDGSGSRGCSINNPQIKKYDLLPYGGRDKTPSAPHISRRASRSSSNPAGNPGRAAIRAGGARQSGLQEGQPRPAAGPSNPVIRRRGKETDLEVRPAEIRDGAAAWFPPICRSFTPVMGR